MPSKLPPVTKSKPKGRPCLLKPSVEQRLLSAIEEGLPLKQAAMLAGVSYDTFNRWRIRGSSEFAPPEFRKFCKALQRAEAKAMQRLLRQISAAGERDWRASAWILERRHREEFNRPALNVPATESAFDDCEPLLKQAMMPDGTLDVVKDKKAEFRRELRFREEDKASRRK